MTTISSDMVFRKAVSIGDASGSVKTTEIIMLPEGVDDLTVHAIGVGGASALIVEESYSSPTNIANEYSGNTSEPGYVAPVWSTLDATLAAVGTTGVILQFNKTPVAIRARQLTGTRTGTLTLTGKRRA